VFPSASQVRTLLGLTRRSDDASSWLMGQAILRNHQIGGIEKDSVGFWCDAKATRNGIPTSDPALCRAVSAEACLKRADEPGLSLIVPHVLPDIAPLHLMASCEVFPLALMSITECRFWPGSPGCLSPADRENCLCATAPRTGMRHTIPPDGSQKPT
jgi:hypothetical protein